METVAAINQASSSTGRGRLTRQEAQELLGQWRTSPLSLAAFARERGLDVKRLYYWRGRLETVSRRSMGLAQVQVTPQPTTGVVVMLPNGMRVELPADWDAAAIAALCGALPC